MTPENIHLNSFMYEPILDMDIVELLNLYKIVAKFNSEDVAGNEGVKKLVAVDKMYQLMQISKIKSRTVDRFL